MNLFIEKVYAEGSSMAEVDAFIDRVNDQILTPIVAIMFTLAIIWFVMGMLKYIQNADSPDKRAEGYQHMLWSVIGLFIMISVVGIINLVLNTFF